MMGKIKYIRWGLTAILLFYVYTETGPATTICLSLMALDIELRNFRAGLK